jgi:putative membrane protein
VTATAAVLVPGFARLFLHDARRDVEVRVHAESLFLRHALFATRARNGVLLLVSRFERKVEIVADVGLREQVGEREWQGVIARMVPLLGASRFADALLEGLACVEALLIAHGFQGPPPGGNELPDRPLDEAGGR